MKKRKSQKTKSERAPKILWANLFCLLDTSSGASMTVRQMLHQLAVKGYEVQILGATVFDNPKGMGELKQLVPDFRQHLHQLVEADDDLLTHQLLVTYSTRRNHLTAHETGAWYRQYLYLLDHFKPDLVWFYGGQDLDLLIPDEARARGIPTAFYLANENYQAIRWCRDVDLILTDSRATADMYRGSVGFAATPVGKFIDPTKFVAQHHQRSRLLHVNPSWEKGASVVIQLALKLERERPDVEIEVVEARADWASLVRVTTQNLGLYRNELSNVTVTPNTKDMRGLYSRARLLLAPSLWWESSGRVLAEGMLNGIPALITDRGGMPEMIDDAGVAFSFPEECYEAPYQHLLSEEELRPLFEAVAAFYDDEVLYEKYVERAWQVGKHEHHIDKATNRLVNALEPLVKQRAGDKSFTANQKKYHRHNLTGIAGKPEFKVDGSYLRMVNGNHRDVGATKALDETQDFSWKLSSKIVVLDNRAKLITTGAAEKLATLGAFEIVAFDPASEVVDPKQYADIEVIQLFQHAILGDGKRTTLYACLAPEMSGTLPPLPQAQLPEHRREDAQVLTTLPINTIALDSINGLDGLDWLILDELNDAIAVLENGTAALEEALLIQVRVAFQPTHERQNNFAELQGWASRNGFRFYRFNDSKCYSHIARVVATSRNAATEQETADVLFVPAQYRMNLLHDEQKLKLAFLFSTVFEADDMAYNLLKMVDEEKAHEYLVAKGIAHGFNEDADMQPFELDDDVIPPDILELLRDS